MRKADRGIGKSESKAILQHIGVFLPVGSGKYTFLSYPLSCIRRCDGRRH